LHDDINNAPEGDWEGRGLTHNFLPEESPPWNLQPNFSTTGCVLLGTTIASKLTLVVLGDVS